jgi:hypothetical protein
MEPQCLECAGKHVGMAHGLILEAIGNYPENADKVRGQLCLAEMHTVLDYYDVYESIHNERVKMESDPSYWPDCDAILKVIHEARKSISK